MKLEKHLNFGYRNFEGETQTESSKVADKWVERFHQSTQNSTEKQMPSLLSNMRCSTSGSKHRLRKGWGFPSRVQRRLARYSKEAPQQNIWWWQNVRKQSSAEKQSRKTLTPDEYLLVAIIKSHFSRKTQLIKQGKIVDHSVEEDEEIESDEEKEKGSNTESELVEDERIEKEISHRTTVISVTVSGMNVVKDE